KVTVIGAGVMGASIAAHMANIGLAATLLDIVPPNATPAGEKSGLTPSDPSFRSKLASQGVQYDLKSKPPSFFVPENARLVRIGNLEDHLDRLREADWIIEAVVENLDIKKTLFQKIAPYVSPRAILATNTSGISIRDMSE